jgi:hypothetical protein
MGRRKNKAKKTSVSLKPRPEKPVDRWLSLAGIAGSIVFFLLPRTPPIIVGSLVLLFGLSIHPVWNCRWIEERLWRRLLSVGAVAVALFVTGYYVWPTLSFEFLQPYWNAEENRMILSVGHKGSEPVFNFKATVYSMDAAVKEAKGFLASQPFDPTHFSGTVYEPEVGKYSAVPTASIWPLDAASTTHRFQINISDRNREYREFVQVKLAAREWKYRVFIWNLVDRSYAINCVDRGFPIDQNDLFADSTPDECGSEFPVANRAMSSAAARPAAH